jgi:hypothetical protein
MAIPQNIKPASIGLLISAYHQVRLDAGEHLLDISRYGAVAAQEPVPTKQPNVA